MGVRAPNGARPILVAGAGRRRGPPPFSVWDLEIGGGGALRQQPLATAGRRAAFGCARTLLDFGIGRARPLLEFCSEKVAALPFGAAFPRAREGGASASGFDPAAPARSYGDCSARADRNRWPRGGCGVCALWHFRLGDRALIRGRAGAERRAANPGRRCWPTARPAAVFCLGLGDRRWRSSSATAARNSWPQGSLRMCSHSVGFWNRPSATAP